MNATANESPAGAPVESELASLRWLPWAMAAFFAAVVGGCAVWRVLAGIGTTDLSIYHSVLLNTAHGRFYFTPLFPKGPLLYQHFDPIMLVLLPFYWALGNGAWPALPISQALAVALTIPAAVRLGRLEGLGPRLRLAIPALLLINPVMHNIVWYDFHPLVFALPLVVWGWVWLREGRAAAGSICWAAALLCKDNVALTVALLGLALALKGRRGIGLIWLVAGMAAFVAIVGVGVGAFRPPDVESVYLVRYGWLGQSGGEIARTLPTRPLWVLMQVVEEQRSWVFLIKMLLPLGLLPLLAPRVLIAAAPELAILLLSRFEPMQSLKFHYPALLLAVLLIAATSGLGRLAGWIAVAGGRRRRWIRRAMACLLVLAVAGSGWTLYRDGRTLPFLQLPRRMGYYAGEPRRQLILSLAERIPADEPISVPYTLLSPIYPFITRPWIAFLPNRADLARYVVFDLRTRAFGGWKDAGLDAMVERFRKSPEQELFFERKGLVVFRRRVPAIGDPAEFRKAWIGAAPAG